MEQQAKVAIVTGASRGIGKACALHLAKAGFDLGIGARTLHEGQEIEHSLTVKNSDRSALPGSLETTAAAIRALGRRVLVSQLDLLDRRGIEAFFAATMREFQRVDVLVNNARYVGPGHMDPFVDTPIDLFDTQFQCNVLAPLHLCKLVAAPMIAQGGGVIMNVSSGAGQKETAAMPGEGGWGLGYSITKAALNRSTLGLAKELKRHNIAVLNLEPGFVATERTGAALAQFGYDISEGLSMEVPGLTCAAIATHPQAMFFSGKTVYAPAYVVEHGLVDPATLPSQHGPARWGYPGRQ